MWHARCSTLRDSANLPWHANGVGYANPFRSYLGVCQHTFHPVRGWQYHSGNLLHRILCDPDNHPPTRQQHAHMTAASRVLTDVIMSSNC